MLRQADDHIVHRDPDPAERPNHWVIDLKVEAGKPAEFALKVRIPWWVKGRAVLTVNGREERIDATPSSFVTLRRTWKDDQVRLVLPKALTVSPLPDRPDTVAFMDGPVVLAALTSEEQTLYGDPQSPESMLAADNEREWSTWLGGYRTVGQGRGMRFVPLHTITDQTYTVYFPVQPRK